MVECACDGIRQLAHGRAVVEYLADLVHIMQEPLRVIRRIAKDLCELVFSTALRCTRHCRQRQQQTDRRNVGSFFCTVLQSGQHIKELHIRRWLSQRPASDLLQQGMIRLTPARPHRRPQIAFHAAADGCKMLSGLLVEALGDQQNMVRLLLHLFQHIDGVVKAGQLSRYAQQTKKAIRIQRSIQILLRDITYQILPESIIHDL